MGHPHLRKVAQPVPQAALSEDWFIRLLEDMQHTLADYGGVGLAAPQIDAPLRIAIIEIAGSPSRYGELEPIGPTTFINPQLEVPAGTASAGFWEGCLSVPGLRGYVRRPQQVLVRYTDSTGTAQSLEFNGFHATVVQHEFDHLDGRLYIDRISDTRHLMFEQELERHIDIWTQSVDRSDTQQPS